LIHPNRLLREGLAVALFRQNGFEIVGSTFDVASVTEQAKELKPEVIILGNLGNDNAVSTIRMLAATCPNVKIIAMEIANSDDDVLECIEAGAVGYVLKDASFEEMVKVIEAVRQGQSFVSPGLTASLCRRLATLRRLAQPFVVAGCQPLTRREQEILPLIAAGLQNKEIAVRLNIETQTVKNHLHNMLEKLGLRSRHEIARHAQLNRLI